MTESFQIFPVGVVKKANGLLWIEIFEEYADALFGLEGFSHIYVLYWFHEHDTPENRTVLQVHPRRDSANPLTGVFGTHSPLRPNLIGLTLCKITAIKGNRIEIDDIDALDGSPVVDIKCYIPHSVSANDVRLPNWV
jgi:tRNA-Thr(GGU) m(6)t(6)A37 methyltransferase TsaA